MMQVAEYSFKRDEAVIRIRRCGINDMWEISNISSKKCSAAVFIACVYEVFETVEDCNTVTVLFTDGQEYFERGEEELECYKKISKHFNVASIMN